MEWVIVFLLSVEHVPRMCKTTPKHPQILQAPFDRPKNLGNGLAEEKWLVKVSEGRGLEVGDMECLIPRENQRVPPEQIKAMTSSHGKERRVGW